MSVKLYNKKTDTTAVCERSDWTVCRDHSASKGWALYVPELSTPELQLVDDFDDDSLSSDDYDNFNGVEVYDLEKEDLEKEVLGNRIVSIEDKKIQLSNGKVLEIEDVSDCCAWFVGDIKAFDFADNVVTGVEKVEHQGGSDAPEAWTLRVLSNHKTIAEVNIEGDSTSGYYCHSVVMTIKG
jgi:hypothetical protein